MLAGYFRAAAAVVAGSVVLGVAVSEANAQTATQQKATQTNALSAIRGTAIAAGQAADYQTLYVDATAGSDTSVGAEGQPLQTVTRALEMAAPNTIIVLAPGRYTRSSGEVFPLRLKSGVTIQGTPGSRNRTAIIEGGGNFESPTQSQQNAAIVAADRAGLAQVAVSNPDGYGVWVESASPTILESAFVGNRQTGIYVASGSPRVQGSYFAGNKIAGLIVFGLSTASIQNNTFDSTGDGIQVSDGATPEIVGNRMTNNEAGLVVIGDANPLLRDNRITGNRRNGVVAVAARTQAVMAAAALTGEETFATAPEPTNLAVSEPTLSESGSEIPAASEAVSRPASSPVAALLDERASREPISVAVTSATPAVRNVTPQPELQTEIQPELQTTPQVPSQPAEETTYTRVPQPADAVPGELNSRPVRRIQPTVRQSFRATEPVFTEVPVPADAVPGELASRSVSPSAQPASTRVCQSVDSGDCVSTSVG